MQQFFFTQNANITSSVGVILLLILLLPSCSMISNWGAPEPKDARAFYVTPKKKSLTASKNVKVNGEFNNVVQVIKQTMESYMDTTASIYRMNEVRNRTLGETPLVKVISPYVVVDSLDEFKKHFTVGTYVLDQDDIEVRPEDMQYKVEAMVTLKSLDLIVEFTAYGYINWNVYQLEKDEFKKLRESDEELIGVGRYRTREVIRTVSRLGEPLTEYEWVVTDVEDQPVTLGKIESQLNNLLIENAAFQNLNATKINR